MKRQNYKKRAHSYIFKFSTYPFENFPYFCPTKHFLTMSKLYTILSIVILTIIISCTRQEKLDYNDVVPLPSLFITLPPQQFDSILNDQELKMPAEALLLDANKDTLYEGSLSHIKTRGNSTFEGIKKPFSIKFPRKQKFLGLDKSRSFVLLSNQYDYSYIRNAIAFDLAHLIGLPAPQYTFLSLYVNGEYIGLYQMTNKVEVSKHTLNITDLDELNKQANPRPLNEYELFYHEKGQRINEYKGSLLEHDPEDISGGYLIDNSGLYVFYDKSESGFVSNAGDAIRIRSPKYASLNEVKYISNLYNLMEEAVMADDGYNPHTGKHYSDYINVESFARFYLLNELLLNQDGGFASFYMYKDADCYDEKIYAGPAWDFDVSLGTRGYGNKVVLPNEIFVGSKVGEYTETLSGGLLYHLLQHNDFQIIVSQLYNDKLGPVFHDYLTNGNIDHLSKTLYSEAKKDNQLYKSHADFDLGYAEATKTIKDFLRDRLDFFDWYFKTPKNNLISIEYKGENTRPHLRNIYIYYPTNRPIYPPVSLRPYDATYNHTHTPIPELYYAGTDSIVSNGTILKSPQQLELRKREPTKKEVLKRRIKKKLAKWGINI